MLGREGSGEVVSSGCCNVCTLVTTREAREPRDKFEEYQAITDLFARVSVGCLRRR